MIAHFLFPFSFAATLLFHISFMNSSALRNKIFSSLFLFALLISRLPLGSYATSNPRVSKTWEFELYGKGRLARLSSVPQEWERSWGRGKEDVWKVGKWEARQEVGAEVGRRRESGTRNKR